MSQTFGGRCDRAGSRIRLVVVAVTVGLITAACSVPFDNDDEVAFDDPGDCVIVETSVSSEKIALMTDLAESFNRSGAEVDGTCIFVRPQSVASGLGAQLLTSEWPEDSEGPRPVIWSPASSAWGAVVNQRLSEQGRPEIVGPGSPFMVTPLVIAMPETMARALGWPDADLGWADILDLATSEDGWAAYGHPEWGEFRLGKTNPNFSTSGLSALIAQTYAAAGKSENLSSEDLRRPQVQAYGEGVESAVVHYGDTTLTFLNNWYRADQRGAALGYVSAAAVEEKSVIDYNQGNPDGTLDLGEELRPPREKLVAIYPVEGTLYSDNPLYVLDAEWVSPEQAEAAEQFVAFTQTRENQERVLEGGFRPGDPTVPLADPISPEFGVDPDQPQDALEVPAPQVMTGLLELWDNQRKPAQVTLLLDVSGSMGDLGSVETGETKLDLAKRAIVESLPQFADADNIALVSFTTDISGRESVLDVVVASGPASQNASEVERALAGIFPRNGTPLYDAVHQEYERMLDDFDAERINALVVLSDGRNDDADPSDDDEQLDELLRALARGSEGVNSRPVRVFPIAYGSDADRGVLQSLAEASASAVYDASDPRSITKVFAEVISNF